MAVFNAVAGEWLEYTINIPTFGNYDISVRAASHLEGGTFHLDVDGINVTGILKAPTTGGWQTFQSVTRRGVRLSPGTHVLRLAMDSNSVSGVAADFDSITILPSLATPDLVSSALVTATTLASMPNPSAAQIAPLAIKLEQAYASFLLEANNLPSQNSVGGGLRAALYFTRAAYGLSEVNVSAPMVQGRLQIAASYLAQVNSLVLTGSNVPADASATAHAPSSATASPVIGPADTRSSATFAPVLSSASLGTILGDPNQSPLSTQTIAATQTVDGKLPYELGGVSVMVGGRAAQVLSVSPSRVSFLVPTGLSVGEAEVIVTLQAGYVSRGTVTIAPIALGIFTKSGNGTGEAVAFDSNAFRLGPFDVLASNTSSADKRVRLIIFTTGISNGASNFDISNDPLISGTSMANVAESVVVEARKSDGTVFNLTVEYAGAQGPCPGLDEVNVVLPAELKGAGVVELTLVTGGMRSNAATVNIR